MLNFNLSLVIFLVQYLKNQWKNIRDNFKRALTKEMSPHALAQDTQNHLEERLTADKYSDNDISLEIETTSCSTATKDLKEKSTKKDQKRKRKSEDGDQLGTYLVQSLKKIDDVSHVSSPSNQHTEDADTLFCKSLINRIKELPKKKNKLARLKMEEVLFKIECDDD